MNAVAEKLIECVATFDVVEGDFVIAGRIPYRIAIYVDGVDKDQVAEGIFEATDKLKKLGVTFHNVHFDGENISFVGLAAAVAEGLLWD